MLGSRKATAEQVNFSCMPEWKWMGLYRCGLSDEGVTVQMWPEWRWGCTDVTASSTDVLPVVMLLWLPIWLSLLNRCH